MKLTPGELLELQDQAWENGYDQGRAGKPPKRPRDVDPECASDEPELTTRMPVAIHDPLSIPQIAVVIVFRVEGGEGLTTDVEIPANLGALVAVPRGAVSFTATRVER